MKLPVIVLAASVAATSAVADDTKYTVADLKALVADGSFREAFLHIGDVPPAQRKGDWIDVAANAAGGALGTLDTDDGSIAMAIDQIDKDFPQLRKSTKYAKPRAELGFKGLEGCFAQTDGYWSSYGLENCVKLALRFVDNSGGDRALALKVAKLARRSMNAQHSAVFFTRALAPKDASACKDRDLELAMVAGLGLPPDHANAAAARELMTTCWATLKAPVVKAFDESSAGYLGRNVCDQLVATKSISGLQLKQCQKLKAP